MESNNSAAVGAETLQKALSSPPATSIDSITFSTFEKEEQMIELMRLIEKGLSEPYSVYTYRYFINNWPQLCILAHHSGKIIGTEVLMYLVNRNNCLQIRFT